MLRTLAERGVDLIVVGGVCAVLHGAPLTTFDLDIVHCRRSENVERLLVALQQLKARYRDLRGRRITPERSHLESEGHQLLVTDKGPLDILGAIGNGRGYDDLLQNSQVIEVAGFEVRVLNLDTLIEIKEETGRPKDQAVLELLRQTLKERSRSR